MIAYWKVDDVTGHDKKEKIENGLDEWVQFESAN